MRDLKKYDKLAEEGDYRLIAGFYRDHKKRGFYELLQFIDDNDLIEKFYNDYIKEELDYYNDYDLQELNNNINKE